MKSLFKMDWFNGAAKQQGSFRIGSAIDADASYRVRGLAPEDTSFGYNIPVSVSQSGFVCEIRAYTGTVPEQKERQGICPEKLIYDAGGAGMDSSFAFSMSNTGREYCQKVKRLPTLVQGCPRWEKCRKAGLCPCTTRQVFISDYREYVLAAYNQTEDFTRDMQLRSAIERVIFKPGGVCPNWK